MVVPKKKAKKKTKTRTKRTRTKNIAKLRPKRSPAVRAWLRQELKEQEARYRKIVEEMEALASERDQWIENFFERIQDRGFSMHADIRRKVKPSELPKRPKRKLRVVY